MLYKTEFPDYDDTLPEIEGFVDDSWHNDSCPKLIKDLGYTIVTLWCDYKDLDKREYEGAPRYSIAVTDSHEGIVICETEDREEAIEAARSFKKLQAPRRGTTEKNDELSQLTDRIREIAIKNCGDYPGIETCSAWEMLYAIECAIIGTSQACDDWSKAVKKLGSKIGMTNEELYNFLVKDES